jgi:peptide/nickel transport system substrate-binding protein
MQVPLDRRPRARGTRRPIALAALVAIALAVAARAEVTPPAGELRVGVASIPSPLDPATAATPAELMATRLVFQGLVAFGERGDLEPALASAWSVSRDGLVWTFRLRPDVQLHDGSPLGADDVVAALTARLSDDEAPEGAPPWVRPLRGAGRAVREFRRGPAGTVQVVLAHPYAPVLALLAHPGLAVAVPRGAARLGTGPYRVAEAAPGRVVLEAAATWRGEPPGSERLALQQVADDTEALAGLGPGGPLDAAFVGSPPAWAALGLQVVSATTWRVGLLAVRTDRGLTSRKTIRQAVALGIDPALLRAALGRWAVPHGGFLPPDAWAARDAAAPTPDLARARRLLAQVAPLDPALVLVAAEQRSGPDGAAVAEAIRQSLAAAGFRPQVRVEPPDVALAAARQGAADLALIETALEVNDPEFYLRPLLATNAAAPGTGASVASLRSPLVDGMLTRASQLGFRPERLRLYHRLQALLAEELPYVPLYARLEWLVARPDVQGARLDPSGVHRLETMRIQPPPEVAPVVPALPPPPPLPSPADPVLRP